MHIKKVSRPYQMTKEKFYLRLFTSTPLRHKKELFITYIIYNVYICVIRTQSTTRIRRKRRPCTYGIHVSCFFLSAEN